ncbi:MAG: phosphoglucosamine mutase [Planctomycetes bacterium]|nr:phosphoglucosamine mutase [Planctomycetota bacterium]
MHQRIFGTDGIRDVANTNFLTAENVLKLGKILGYLLKNKASIFHTHRVPAMAGHVKHGKANGRHSVLIGRDTRISGPMIENALASGLCSQGIDVIQAGVISTPALAYLTRKKESVLGIIISASHNQCESNGIKIFSSEGIKIPDKAEILIEKYLLDKLRAKFTSKQTGRLINAPESAMEYVGDIVNGGIGLKGLRIAVDCANGATSLIAPEIFGKLGAKVIPVNNCPNGTNINRCCGSLYPEAISRAVKRYKADIGFSFDGDGDRLIVSDEKGAIIDGDYMLVMLAKYLKKKRMLRKNMVVTTVMANTGLEVALKKEGINIIRTPVGDRNVADVMFKNGYIIGGEQSGHIILLHRSVTGDGIITALELLRVMKTEGKSLSRLSKCMAKYPQVLINLKVKTKPELTSLKGYDRILSQTRGLLDGMHQIVIRYSGTEPLLRIMIEAQDKKAIESAGKKLVGFFREHLKIME